ncbi:MAG: 50S ribosomal protein L25 [Desulfobulbaceae bacterium]|nr:50S ribosomal protein L25 [Desulfobulbaceae bacterium]
MLQVDMRAEKRTAFGKGAMRQLRMREATPAVVYSGGLEPLPLKFATAQLFKDLHFIHGRNAVVNLDVAGDDKGRRHVLVQEIQKDPVSGELLHVDFVEVDLDKPAKFSVPLQYKGTPKGVDLGGDLQVHRTEVQLFGRPLDIPDVIEVDIRALEQGGKGLTYADIAVPAGVEMLSKGGTVCVQVV